MDTQLAELLGRDWLTSLLHRVGLEVRDGNVKNDLIAYRDVDEKQQFLAYPIQMKAATSESA